MNSHNIAMVFAPNMTQMVDPLTALLYAVQVMNLLKMLITKALRECKLLVIKTRFQCGVIPTEVQGAGVSRMQLDPSLKAIFISARTQLMLDTLSDLQKKVRDQHCIATALAEYEANRGNGNGDDNHDSGSGRRTERATRECTYSDFLKCQPLNFMGTEGVIGLTQ
ncbi:putative reverse transcriptase domain-containing protein [Tanacetum coccineum]